MSRDLSFWKCKNTPNISNSMIYHKLSEEKFLDCIAELPLEQIIIEFNNVFKEWNIENNKNFERGTECFQLFITKQFVRIDCYSLSEFNMNKIIDILNKYDCPLYDPTIDVRFEC